MAAVDQSGIQANVTLDTAIGKAVKRGEWDSDTDRYQNATREERASSSVCAAVVVDDKGEKRMRLVF